MYPDAEMVGPREQVRGLIFVAAKFRLLLTPSIDSELIGGGLIGATAGA